ncbi:meiosis initiator protein [Pogona vitticeps]
MWDQIGRVCPEELQSNSKNFKQNLGDRRKCDNYANTLKELAGMLPIPLRTNCKRLTKKEILLRVLQYIEHLQESIDTARSLLHINSDERKGEAEQLVVVAPAQKRGQREATPRTKKTKPMVVCKKPRKRRRTRKSDRRAVNKKACKCLALETENIPCQAGRYSEENSLYAVGKVNSILSSSQKQSPFFPNFQVPVPESYQPASTTSLDVTPNGVQFHTTDWSLGSNEEEGKNGDMFSVCAAQVAYDELHQYVKETGHSSAGQELVCYNSSCEEEDEEGPRASPWLSTQSPIGMPLAGSMQLCSPRIETQNNSCSDLGLSPSLFSSPGRLLTRHTLQGIQEEFSPVLFEDVYMSLQSNSFAQTLSGTLLRKPAFNLDHCYLSYSETGQSDSSPVSRVNEAASSWNKQFLQEEASNIRSEGPMSSSDENSDATWTPCKRTKPPQVACQKRKKVVRRQKRRPGLCEKHSSSSLQLKKKCVNGFIMFCRLNRRHFIRAYPGMASTAATRELAQLWRMMTKQERKPYCLKARRFSRMNNRIVREDNSSGEEEMEPPKPFHLLLAEKSFHGAQNFGDYSLLDFIP